MSDKLRDLLNLTAVPRWSIVPMHRSQSVAEHSHRCAAICMEILDQFSETDPGTRLDVLTLAITHDAPESFSGDVPSPFKHFHAGVRSQLESVGFQLCPWLKQWIELDDTTELPVQPDTFAIVHIADLIEAYTWWVMFMPSYWDHPWAVNRSRILLDKVKSAADSYAERFDWPQLPDIARAICHQILTRTEEGNSHAAQAAQKIVSR